MVTRTICVITSSRADYGLLRGVMRAVAAAPSLTLRVIVTGAHLHAAFGETWREIEADGVPIDARVPILTGSDAPLALAAAMGTGVHALAEALSALSPDLVVLLGDRFETLSAASAALVLRIPVAHLHGGELTTGAWDDAIRHAVTKLSHLHFVAAEPYRRRVIQLGESPARVHLVGGLGVDAIAHVPRLDRDALEADLGIRFGQPTMLVTWHAATLDTRVAEQQVEELLAALDQWPDAHLIFTGSNADSGGRAIDAAISRYVAGRRHARFEASLGVQRYVSCLAEVDVVVGNSSSGLLEAPTLGTPTVNIGDRQRGRLRAPSVIDCGDDRRAIIAAITRALTPECRALASQGDSPYGRPGAAARIVDVLTQVPLDGLTRKEFHDLA